MLQICASLFSKTKPNLANRSGILVGMTMNLGMQAFERERSVSVHSGSNLAPGRFPSDWFMLQIWGKVFSKTKTSSKNWFEFRVGMLMNLGMQPFERGTRRYRSDLGHLGSALERGFPTQDRQVLPRLHSTRFCWSIVCFSDHLRNKNEVWIIRTRRNDLSSSKKIDVLRISNLAWHFLRSNCSKRVRGWFGCNVVSCRSEFDQTCWYWVRNHHRTPADHDGMPFGRIHTIWRPDPTALRASLFSEGFRC